MLHPNELDQQIENLRTLQQSYDQLAGQSEIYNQGKGQLAYEITRKGVPAAASDSLYDMATKVSQIQQEAFLGISDFEQMIAPSPYIWNVYSVANDIMADTRPAYLPSYITEYKQRYGTNSFFVGEYYLGYASLELAGADGYLTCDGDFYTISDGVVTHTLPDGTVETYSAESIIHIWHDTESGRCNRWVAFFYSATAYAFANTVASICPRRVALCGECVSFIITGENRLTDVWVLGTLVHFEGGTTGTTWNTAQVIRHLESISYGTVYTGLTGISCILPDLKEITSTGRLLATNANPAYILMPDLVRITSSYAFLLSAPKECQNVVYVRLPKLQTLNVPLIAITNRGDGSDASTLMNLSDIILDTLEEINITSNGGSIAPCLFVGGNNGGSAKMKRILLPNLKRITTGGILSWRTTGSTYLIDVEVGAMETSLDMRCWNAVNILSDPAQKAILIDNIKNHILAKVSDRTGDTQLVFTVSTNMYNEIAAETIEWNGETMTLADAFLTKNWLLAGA